MNLSELHNCEKCHGKIVSIATKNGISRCGYCNEIVNYKEFFEQEIKIIK